MTNNKKNKKSFKLQALGFRIQSSDFRRLAIAFIFCFLLSVPITTNGAVLYLEPSIGEYYLEDVFIVEIRLNTEGKEINAAQVSLKFSEDRLVAKDFSSGDSVLSLWMQGPDFLSKEGRIDFIGGAPGGYQGDGLLAKIIFQAKNGREQFSAKIEFLENSQVLLNDGLGTAAELKTKEAIFTILPEKLETSRDEWQKILKEDNIPPEPFEIIITQDASVFSGKHFLVFAAVDKQTGIDYYEVKEGKGSWKRAASPYLLEDQSLKSKILVRAVDKAGNERIAEYLPPKEPFPYWTIVLILLGIGIIFWIAKRSLKREA